MVFGGLDFGVLNGNDRRGVFLGGVFFCFGLSDGLGLFLDFV